MNGWSVGAIVLMAFVHFGHGAALGAVLQGTASTDTSDAVDTPLTGRAIPCENGRIKSFECQNVELLAYLPASAIGKAAGYDLWGWSDSTTDREFALIGGASGTAFVEVTDPVALDDPVVVTEFYGTTSATDHNLYVRGRYMYQANYQAGLRIVDIADPKRPKEVGYLANAGSAWTNYPFFKNDVVAVSMSTGLFLVRRRSR